MTWFLKICFLCPLLCLGSPTKWQNEEEALFLNRIADFWEEGEYQIAKKQIQEFLNIYPNSAYKDTLSSCLGDLFLREKNFSQALDYYAKITDTETSSRIFVHRLQCLYNMQWYSTLADECETYLQNRSANLEDDFQITYYLAIALYQQCLNAENDLETLNAIAKRAAPYFEELFETAIKEEIAPAFAHLLCILKEFPKAAEIYLDLATDEMLFQAAFIQAEYDKELALQTFRKIASSDAEKSIKEEAQYNGLILSFDLQKYEEISNAIEAYLESIPVEKIPAAHLFFGRSFLALGKVEEACIHLKKYVAQEQLASPLLYEALLSFIDASMQAEDLGMLDTAINKIDSLYANNGELLKGKFFKALLLEKKEKFAEARELLEELLISPLIEKEEVLAQLIHIESGLQDYISCRNHSLAFLSEYATSNQTAIIESHLVAASLELSNQSIEGKEQLVLDLQHLLTTREDEKWQILLAKTFFALQEYEKAIPILEALNTSETDLILALCYRDGNQDLEKFAFFAERALQTNPKSFDEGSLHAALYNAYLDLAKTDVALLEKAEEHLFAAFEAKTVIDIQNLLWLANRYIARESNLEAIALLESVEQTEKVKYPLAKLYCQTKNFDKALPFLEELVAQSDLDWKEQSESFLLLGEIYAMQGNKEKAKHCFDQITCDKSLLKTYVGASASLQSARLEIQDVSEVLVQLKDLTLQKNILHEPIYLEAALDYIELQDKSQTSSAKKLALLEKTKRDFESQDDLLSQDYHLARTRFPAQNFIFASYMKFIEAEILIAKSDIEADLDQQKELQAKAKDLLLKIVEEKAHPALVVRASQCLDR